MLKAKHRSCRDCGLKDARCVSCGAPWPCDVGVMHSALDSAERDREAAERQLEALTTEAAWALSRVKALEAALAWYADDDNYQGDYQAMGDSLMDWDRGERARTALAENA